MRTALVIILFLSWQSSFAQQEEPYIYAELGGGDGTHGLLKLALTSIFYGKNAVSIDYDWASHKSPDIPPGYPQPWLFPVWPQQTLHIFGLSYGRVFFLRNRRTRFLVKGGLAIDRVETATNFVLTGNTLFGPDYSFSYRRNVVAGLSLNPVVEFPLARAFGFSIGPYANINAVSSVLGLDVCMMFGRLTGKKLRKHHQQQ